MEMQFDAQRIASDQDGVWLCLRVRDITAARGFVMKATGLYTAKLSKYRKKRSNDANAYCWALLDKLADALDTTKEELYRECIRHIGPHKDFTLTEDEAKTFRVAWERLGTGWPTEQVDYSQDGEKVVVRAYYGSSTYNTRQMSRLIDQIVAECKAQGIETLPPDRLAALMEDWNAQAN